MPAPATTPVFILCRDRLTPLQELVGWLESAGFEEIRLLDNDSAYPPMVEYLAASPHEVMSLGRNVGKHALWLDRRFDRLIDRRPFVYTDPDVVPDADCPRDGGREQRANRGDRRPSVHPSRGRSPPR